MPRHDFSIPPNRRKDVRVQILKPWWAGKRKPGRGAADGGLPVDPRKPNTLSGGAAAELDFGDD